MWRGDQGGLEQEPVLLKNHVRGPGPGNRPEG
jgi:hypothetical protein